MNKWNPEDPLDYICDVIRKWKPEQGWLELLRFEFEVPHV